MTKAKAKLDAPTLRWVYRELRKWQKHWATNGGGFPGTGTVSYTFGAAVDLLQIEARAIERAGKKGRAW